ncbi:putative endonuclease [Syntrophus gentianae]|uniref:Putative endonuclease n=1 Tax=Syntrophus gentianae TaxID=43775 RepID=A0A1H7YEQ9_9BACT|nr:GIY-YIG nuclease family protein [Syntrophus gentianae]SEM44610.1 putative endonuclease [Syntrophus gentianae]
MNSHYVYILECSDKTLYTGWTNNLEKRVQEHNSGRYGAKYTSSRRPVKLVYVERLASLSDVLKREGQIKKLSRKKKLQLIENGLDTERG